MGILIVFWKWLIMLSLAFWIGMLVTEGIVFKGLEQTSILLVRSQKWVRPLQWICLLVLLVAQAVTFILQVTQLTQNGTLLEFVTSGQLLIQSTYGFLWIGGTICILTSLALLIWTTSQSPSGLPSIIIELILASLILFTYAFTNEVAEANTRLHVYAIVLVWFSLVAQSSWFGALAYLGYIFLPSLRSVETEGRNEILTNALQRLQPFMFTAICVLFVSELYLSTISMSNREQFITTPYGRALLIKWILILIVILLSTYVFFALRPKLSASFLLLSANKREIATRYSDRFEFKETTKRLQQLFSIQAGLGIAVFLCAALMTIFMPPIVLPSENSTQNPRSSATPTNTNTTQTKQVGNLSVMLTVTPGMTGVSNTVLVRLTDTRSDKAVTDARIEISLNMELMDMGTVQATLTGGNPAYKATFAQGTTFSMSGVWDIKLVIQLPDQESLVVVFTVLFLSPL